MSVHDDLGNRMKSYYEQIPKTKLMRKVPVALRIDGKAFHSFTKGFEKPFDWTLMEAMQETMKYLCQNIQGCVFGYTQSDEITLILTDYKKLESDAWFDYEVQKLCSISASMATMYFNKIFDTLYLDRLSMLGTDFVSDEMLAKDRARKKGAMFDCRCFNIPKEEVANLLYWRQLDAERNSIQMCGRAFFSHKDLWGKSCKEIKELLSDEKEFDWEDLEGQKKYGSACYKIQTEEIYDKSIWFIDTDLRPFKDDWDFINRHIFINEEKL